ncbi:hypothetical protein Vretimale_18467, partial [Volvox reticuliferus]
MHNYMNIHLPASSNRSSSLLMSPSALCTSASRSWCSSGLFLQYRTRATSSMSQASFMSLAPESSPGLTSSSSSSGPSSPPPVASTSPASSSSPTPSLSTSASVFISARDSSGPVSGSSWAIGSAVSTFPSSMLPNNAVKGCNLPRDEMETSCVPGMAAFSWYGCLTRSNNVATIFPPNTCKLA